MNYTERNRRFARNFSKILKDRGLSDVELARITDTNEITVRHWREGVSAPNYKNMKKISAALGTEECDLIGTIYTDENGKGYPSMEALCRTRGFKEESLWILMVSHKMDSTDACRRLEELKFPSLPVEKSNCCEAPDVPDKYLNALDTRNARILQSIDRIEERHSSFYNDISNNIHTLNDNTQSMKEEMEHLKEEMGHLSMINVKTVTIPTLVILTISVMTWFANRIGIIK